jgi:hypothetical protein
VKPTVGRIVLYRMKTGTGIIPALINGTTESLNPLGIEVGALPPLSSDLHVHLVCFTPGRKGTRIEGTPEITPEQSPNGVMAPYGGTYQEWDIAPCPDLVVPDFVAERSARFSVSDDEFPPGTWAWPAKG